MLVDSVALIKNNDTMCINNIYTSSLLRVALPPFFMHNYNKGIEFFINIKSFDIVVLLNNGGDYDKIIFNIIYFCFNNTTTI